MRKLLILSTLFFSFMAIPAFSADFRVHSVNQATGQAILIDKETGATWRVKEGDRINGTLVHQICKTHVTIITPLDKHNGVAVVIPTVTGVNAAKRVR